MRHIDSADEPEYDNEFIFGMSFIRDRKLTIDFSKSTKDDYAIEVFLFIGKENNEAFISNVWGGGFAFASFILVFLFFLYLVRLKKGRN